MKLAAAVPLLTDVERSCLERYLDVLAGALGEQLLEVSVYGSVARGEAWPPGMPIRSDLDLLVLTSSPVPEEVQTELLDATMPLFLECGRQLGPIFLTPEELERPATEGRRALAEHISRDAIRVYEARVAASRRFRQ